MNKEYTFTEKDNSTEIQSLGLVSISDLFSEKSINDVITCLNGKSWNLSGWLMEHILSIDFYLDCH